MKDWSTLISSRRRMARQASHL